jgi:hypothetical protein
MSLQTGKDLFSGAQGEAMITNLKGNLGLLSGPSRPARQGFSLETLSTITHRGKPALRLCAPG